jgi:hypothetical protein
MVSWGEFASQRKDLADTGRTLLYQFGVGLAFLGTVRTDGGPRLHPMCPVLADDGLYAFIVPSLKQDDLRRDGLYALHSFPCPDNEDAFYVTGRARVIDDKDLFARLARQFVEERAQLGVPSPTDRDELFEFDIERVLLTRTKGHGDPSPAHTVWRAP